MKLHEIMKVYFSLAAILLLLVMPSFGSSSLHHKPEVVVALQDAAPLLVATSLTSDASNVVDKVIQMFRKGDPVDTANLADKAARMLQKNDSKVIISLLVLIGLVVIILLSTLIGKIRRWALLRRLDREDSL